MMGRPTVLVSNLMMREDRARFDNALRELGAEPIWPEVRQFLSENECLEWAGKIDVWAAGDDVITERVLSEHFPRLVGIAKWGTGLDSIDLKAARKLGVPVSNTPGAFSDAVSEVALGYMLALSRSLFEIDQQVRSGAWPKPQRMGLLGATVGVIGYGAIGKGIAKRAVPFGAKIVAFDPFSQFEDLAHYVQPVSLRRLFSESDFICLACSANDENRHLINQEALAMMKRDAVIVNVSRGSLIDEAALVAALEASHIGGAGLDVFEIEPLPRNSKLMSFNNVILGSHNANNQSAAVEHVHQNTLKHISGYLEKFGTCD